MLFSCFIFETLYKDRFSCLLLWEDGIVQCTTTIINTLEPRAKVCRSSFSYIRICPGCSCLHVPSRVLIAPTAQQELLIRTTHPENEAIVQTSGTRTFEALPPEDCPDFT